METEGVLSVTANSRCLTSSPVSTRGQTLCPDSWRHQSSWPPPHTCLLCWYQLKLHRDTTQTSLPHQPEPRSPVPLKNIPSSLHSWDVDVENLDVENSSTCS